jgi:DNA-binding response OmpR family regulator
MQKILIADDNKEIGAILKEYAAAQGFAVDIALNGLQALTMTDQNHYAVILLDIMMPGMDGIDVCRHIRQNSRVPIIMISAKTEEEDRILGLDIGADDYISKPFSPKEVMARVRALLRRTGDTEKNHIQCGELEIDQRAHMVTIAGTPIQLTKKEEALLVLMANYPGRVFTRQDFLTLAWSYDSDSNDRAVDTHIKRLRAKLDAVPHEGFSLETVWGVGYKLEKINA